MNSITIDGITYHKGDMLVCKETISYFIDKGEEITITNISDNYISFDDNLGISSDELDEYFIKKDIYMVGGCIRDYMMDIQPKDIDFVAVGYTKEECLNKGWKQVGKDFPVFIDENGYEIALARTERSTGKGYNDFEVLTEYVTLKEDCKRRDLKFNSMAMDSKGNIIDYYNGCQDLEDEIIDCFNEETFIEDPLRILRACRFMSRFPNFKMSDRLYKICEDNAHLLKSISKERILSEVKKVLKEQKPSIFFKTIYDISASKYILGGYHYIDNIFEVLDKGRQEGQPLVHLFGVLSTSFIGELNNDFKELNKISNSYFKSVLQYNKYSYLTLYKKLYFYSSSYIVNIMNERNFPKDNTLLEVNIKRLDENFIDTIESNFKLISLIQKEFQSIDYNLLKKDKSESFKDLVYNTKCNIVSKVKRENS